jgi:glycosyltransferase involved in cell wall biosynthesis
MRKTVLVLTAIERAFYSSTIEYQLMEPVMKVVKGRKNLRVVFLCLVPLTFYLIRGEKKRSYTLFQSRRRRIRENLKENGISIHFIPTLFPLRHRSFYLRWFEIFLYLLFNFVHLFLMQMRYNPVVIHARGYPASLLAYMNNRLKSTRYIFDMRDVYQKKGVEGGIFSEKDISFRLWEYLEWKIARHANGVIVTSRPFYDYVEGMVDDEKSIWMIPNSVNTVRFSENDDIRTIVRKRLKIDNRFVLLHSGTFSTPGDTGLAIRYFKRWQQHKEGSYFLILTPNSKNIERIQKVFTEENIDPMDYKIISPEPEEVPDLLRAGDIGLHLESKALATEYCIAIKDGEYLATGLPVICTPHLKGIAPLIERYECGIIVDPERDCSFEKEKNLLRGYGKIKENTKQIVDEVLSIENSAETLGKLYATLLEPCENQVKR